MYCLRCGKDTQEKQVFCDSCLLVMEAYPVKPGTAIHLPVRKALAEQKKQSRRRKVPSQQELLQRSRTLNRWLLAAVVVLSGMVAALLWMLL